MLTKERMIEIEEMVEMWNEKEEEKEEYPNDIDFPLLGLNIEESEPELFSRAAKEMGIDPKELHEFFEEVLRNTEEENQERYLSSHCDSEEQLREDISLAKEARKDFENL